MLHSPCHVRGLVYGKVLGHSGPACAMYTVACSWPGTARQTRIRTNLHFGVALGEAPLLKPRYELGDAAIGLFCCEDSDRKIPGRWAGSCE